MESERVVVGWVLRFSIEQWSDTELLPHIKAQMRQMIDAQVAEKGYEALGEVSIEPQPYRLVKESHHEHGWQWVEQPCSLEEAGFVALIAEVPCAKR